ncbi:MAG TPA: tRNA dihydrouridine synthase DusB [Bacteroidales bacterium]|nr:tRNA dihydrouridine synthase DusB [Bacteroidales bacterium]
MHIGPLLIDRKTPLLAAPMEDITDPPFRALCRQHGADMVFTEFASSEGLLREARKTLNKLDVLENERPVGIQLFGHRVEAMVEAARITEAAGPDVIDLNFGCPVKKVIAKGAGAAMLKDPDRMVSIASAVVQAVKVPVTVKTRIGWDDSLKPIVEVAERLQDAGISMISIHGRTARQLYGGTADWSMIAEVKNNPRMHIPIIGNGDVISPETAREKLDRYGVDGLMIGRAMIGYPWIFREVRSFLETGTACAPPTLAERLEVSLGHLERSISRKGERLAVLEIRKHYARYFKGLPDFKPFKLQLMKTETLDQVKEVFGEIGRAY